MVDEERKRKWIKEMRDKCGKFIVMHTCYKCGKVDGLGVSSDVDMSFLCLDCLANMLFEKTPSRDVKDFAKI